MREKRERTGSRTKKKKWKEKEEQLVKKRNEKGEGEERKKRERTGRRTKKEEWEEKGEREEQKAKKGIKREAREKRERRGRRGREVKERRERKLTDRNKDLSERLQLTYITSKELYIKIVKLRSKWTLLCRSTTYINYNNNKL